MAKRSRCKTTINKIRLLVSDTAPLYPPLWGGPKRVWGLYSNLGDMFDITYVGVDPSAPSEYRNRKVKDNIREIIQPLARIYYPFRRFEIKAIKNLTFDIFTYILMWMDKGFVKELNKHDSDILISSHPWSSPCFRIKKGRIFIYDAHNCEYLLMKQILAGRWYNKIISFFVKIIEVKACRKARIILVSSGKDKESFMKLYGIPEDKIFVLPNGTYIERISEEKGDLSFKKNERPLLLFIGAYYNPNIEAAKFIAEDVAPALNWADIAMVGTVSDYFRDKKVPANVKLIGRVDDKELFDWLKRADIGLNPMFTGSGINMKVLDYFSYSLPVVTTWVGARGLEGVDSRDFIACDKDEFIDKIKLLLEDKDMRVRMGKNARQLAENVYDWKKISLRYGAIIKSAVEGREDDMIKRNICYRCDRA
jgi:glycosyltransferase involved in cell wall biosynthesis